MRRVVTGMLVLAAVACLAACGHKFTRTSLESTLVKGKTTREEVSGLLGEPLRRYTTKGVKMSAGGNAVASVRPMEVWLYSPHVSRIVDLFDPELLRVMFDANGIVANYDFQDDGD